MKHDSMCDATLRTADLASILALLPLAKEGRQRNGGQDADDENHDEQLNEGESPPARCEYARGASAAFVSSLR